MSIGLAIVLAVLLLVPLVLWILALRRWASRLAQTTLRALGTAGLGLLAERKQPVAAVAEAPSRTSRLLAVLGSAGGSLLVSDEESGAGASGPGPVSA